MSSERKKSSKRKKGKRREASAKPLAPATPTALEPTAASGSRAMIVRRPLVGLLLGSSSDLRVFSGALELLKQLAIPFELVIRSAHRCPEETAAYVAGARERGMRVLIAGAGLAAHLAGAVAARTTLPVIGVPIAGGALGGQDALLATVQMPPGVPVATVAIDGAKNAVYLAAQILALDDAALAQRLEDERRARREELLAAPAIRWP